MRLAYLILSVFVATVAAVPNQCTPNGLPCDSQTPCCSKVCVIKGDIGSPNENGTCEDSSDKIDKLMEDPQFRTVDPCLAILTVQDQ
ncbi:hypothetical protein BDV39DRAFT_201739 [Aspergillus sergii]|uniref:Hydrophobin n=1 Tax=Aspergillus sergii TaxID=1034303 RepID=A0A5N6XBX1_9EURO|nr:hypothetical protein BDV39DRAFT_201739 [Aspergillus sergii]